MNSTGDGRTSDEFFFQYARTFTAVSQILPDISLSIYRYRKLFRLYPVFFLLIDHYCSYRGCPNSYALIENNKYYLNLLFFIILIVKP